MNSYERIVTQMRRQGAHDNDYPPMLGTVLTGGRVRIKDLTIAKADYYINSALTVAEGDRVLVLRIGQDFIIVAKVVRP